MLAPWVHKDIQNTVCQPSHLKGCTKDMGWTSCNQKSPT
jgi:hypothetical protein